MKPILEVNNVWKEYKIGGKKQSYENIRDRLKLSFKRKAPKEKFWALQDISFKAYEGDCIGIVGRNGAGKSTLLKILSRITPPTRGMIHARGRLSSLLEVGTGFHPELTGREKIYLNGAILGLRKPEIDKSFDNIVDFSGVEKFLDTPLKHYSSGMKLRLAFSVAAYLEPEILVIDEVLAVGDAEFQRKCIGRMNEVSQEGRTILFVSHDLEAVRKLCTKGIILDNGIMKDKGDMAPIIDTYLSSFTKDSNMSLASMKGENIHSAYQIQQFSFRLNAKKMHFDLELKGGNFANIKSIIYNIIALSGQLTSLIDLREDLKNAIQKQPIGKTLKIASVVVFEYYVEGMYEFSLGIQYKDGNWYQSNRMGFELVNQTINNKYPAKHRGYFEVDAMNNVIIG